MAICICCHNLLTTSPRTATFLTVWLCGLEGFVAEAIGFMSNYKNSNEGVTVMFQINKGSSQIRAAIPYLTDQIRAKVSLALILFRVALI